MALLHYMRFKRDHRWTPDRLSAYLDQDLSPGDRRRVARHTDACPERRGLLHGLRRLLGALQAPRPPEAVAEHLVLRLGESLTRVEER